VLLEHGANIVAEDNALHQHHIQYIMRNDFALCICVEPFDLIDYRYDLSGYDLLSCPKVQDLFLPSQMEKPIKPNNCTENRNRHWGDVGWGALLALGNMRA
jgi:hypothetical protein